MLEQEITVCIGQRLMEVALTDPVGDMLSIFYAKWGISYSLIKDSWQTQMGGRGH